MHGLTCGIDAGNGLLGPYVASATAIDPVVSTATMTSVALMACEVVDDTTLGVSTICLLYTSRCV